MTKQTVHPFKSKIAMVMAGVSVVALTTFGGLSLAHADENANKSPIGLLDINRIIGESSAAKDANTQVAKFKGEFQAEIQKQETKLRDLNNKLIEQQKTLSEADFEKKKKEFDGKVANLQKTVMARDQELQQAAQDSMETVRNSVMEISEKIRTERGFSMVIPSSFAVAHDKSLDITDDVITSLNKKLPKLKVNIGKTKSVSAANATAAKKKATTT